MARRVCKSPIISPMVRHCTGFPIHIRVPEFVRGCMKCFFKCHGSGNLKAISLLSTGVHFSIKNRNSNIGTIGILSMVLLSFVHHPFFNYPDENFVSIEPPTMHHKKDSFPPQLLNLLLHVVLHLIQPDQPCLRERFDPHVYLCKLSGSS